jgi:hypothetical protein
VTPADLALVATWAACGAAVGGAGGFAALVVAAFRPVARAEAPTPCAHTTLQCEWRVDGRMLVALKLSCTRCPWTFTMTHRDGVEVTR